jgi:hypothetical protein
VSAESSCNCPEIKDEEWHLKDFDWSGKFFYFVEVPHVLKVPLALDKKKNELSDEISEKGYTSVNPELVLYQPGMFRGKLLVEIEDPEQFDANVTLFDDARVFTRVHHSRTGSLKNTIEELKAFTLDRSHVLPREIYFWQVTCPHCAPDRGGDKVVLFARV